MSSRAHSQGTPYADCYEVFVLVLLDVSYSLTQEVQVSCHVEWLKPVSSIVKSLIERGTRDKVRKSYGRFFDLVEEDLRANEGASAPPMQDAGLVRSNSTMSVSSVEVPVPERRTAHEIADRVDPHFVLVGTRQFGSCLRSSLS